MRCAVAGADARVGHLAALRRHGRARRGRRASLRWGRERLADAARGAFVNASRAASSSTASPSTPRPRRPSPIKSRRSSGPLPESTSWNRTATRPPALREPKIWRRPRRVHGRGDAVAARGGARHGRAAAGGPRRVRGPVRRCRAAAAAARQRLRRAAVFTGSARRRFAARDRGARPATRAGGAPGRRRHGFWGAAAPAENTSARNTLLLGSVVVPLFV